MGQAALGDHQGEAVLSGTSPGFGSATIYSRTFFRDFWELRSPLGFRIARIVPGGGLLPIDHYSEEHEHFRGVSNYLARMRRPDDQN